MTDKPVKVHLFASFAPKQRPFDPLHGKLELNFEGAVHFERTLKDDALRPLLRCQKYSSKLLRNPYLPLYKNRATMSLSRSRIGFSLRNIGYHLKLTVSGRYITANEKGQSQRIFKKYSTRGALRFFDELTNNVISDFDGAVIRFLDSDQILPDDTLDSDTVTLDCDIWFEGGIFHANPANKMGVYFPEVISFEQYFHGCNPSETEKLLAATQTGCSPKNSGFEKALTAMGFDEAMANLRDLWRFYKDQQWSVLQACHFKVVKNNLSKLEVVSQQLLEHLINPSLVTDAHINAPDLGQLIRRKLSQVVELQKTVESFVESFPEIMKINLSGLLLLYIRDLNRDFFDQQILKVQQQLRQSFHSGEALRFQTGVQTKVACFLECWLKIHSGSSATGNSEVKPFHVISRPTNQKADEDEFHPSYSEHCRSTLDFDRYSVQKVTESSINVFENGTPSVVARFAVDSSLANVYDHYLIRNSKELFDLRQVFKLPIKASKLLSGQSEINQKGTKKPKKSKLLYGDKFSDFSYKPCKDGGMVVRVCYYVGSWVFKFGFIDNLMNERRLQSFELRHVIGEERNNQLYRLLGQEYCCKSHILCLAFSIKDESPDTRVLVAIRSSEDMDVPLLITWKVIRNDVVSLSLTLIEIKASSTTDEAVLGHDLGGRFMIHKGVIFDLYLISSLLYPACIVHCLHKGEFVPFGGLATNPGFHHLIKQRSWVQQTTQPKYMWSSDVWALERSPKLYCHTESFDHKSGTRTYRKYSLRFKW